MGAERQRNWAVIDTNSASDADVWIAWSLLEAGRLWKHPDYTRTGKALLKRIVSEEVVKVPGSARCCFRVKSVLPMRTPGALTPAIFLRS
jgi:endo-1,4-beta-D-glucanase Y